ncbi:uncharacterized protein LOC113500123 isoform X3 [Trichoplusia ni]|uniref:Uncharacterized protein LOC113500123 isoform X3 n=1 Tax=Trichoplusia ni TaxID=7111 RepID=A0A7E5W8R4_TRINI|nr:uncharacterized protein LOC113500123 isoform X3 [Trichoplusia ni]
MMTKEKDDPEKRNLLLEHKEEKKRRQYSGSRTKTGRSGDSSCSEHRKRGHPYKSSSTEHRAEFKLRQTQSVHNQSEKRDSWWFWQKESPKKNTEDTCSCVSCALKKIVNSEYACIGCLLFLFTVSIIVAFLVVFKNVPCLSGPSEKEVPCKHKIPDSERLKRKIEMLNVNRRRNDFLGLDEYRKNDKRGYDDELTGGIGFSGSSGIDFGPSFRELQSSLEDSDTMISGDAWASVMEADKAISDNQSSEKLREFYKKLVQTDAKIKSLKKINQEYLENVEPVLKVPERSKRSLKLNNRPRKYLLRRRRSAFNKNHKIDITKRQANETKLKLNNLEKKQANKTRMEPNNKTKRQVNTTRVNRNDPDEPTGFVIERKKILVRYKPEPAKKKKVPKCSHAPKDSHTHENQLKHPFYKNTQRLDELLDMFLNKNLPEIVSDPFGLDTLFSKEREKSNKCKHPKPHKNVNIIAKELLADQIPKPKPKVQKVKEEAKDEPMILKVLAPESSTQFEKEFAHHEAQMVGKEKQQIVTASPNDFEVLLSVSTIMNPDLKKTGKLPAVIGRLPNIRKLMQIEGDDEENLGYEDFKEVLKDDVENIDDTEKRTDRRKRTEEQQTAQQQQDKFPKYNPPGVHNPNWKGPMPLYPDELNSMLRHSALNSTKAGKTSTTVSNEVQPGLIERRGRDLSDVEYVEDYLNSKYDKLVEMAQAYSDYGVLDGKKETRHEKASDSTATEHRVKMSASPMKSGLFGRFRKDRPQHIQTGTTANVRKYRAISTSEIEEMTEQTGGIPNTFFYTPPRKTSEGIRFEIVPDMTTRGREDNLEVLKILQKHIRIGPTNTPTRIAPKPISPVHTTLISSYPDMEVIYSPKYTKPKSKVDPGRKLFKSDDGKENGLIFAFSKGKRNLLSTDYQKEEPDNVWDTSWDGSLERSKMAFEQFIRNFNVQKLNENREQALANYIESLRQKNIRIYSSVPPLINRNFTKTTNQFEARLSTLMPFDGFYDRDGYKEPSINETVVTINKSEMYKGQNRFEGLMVLTVEDPEIGTEHIDLKFDVPLIIDFNEDLLLNGNKSRSNFAFSTPYYNGLNLLNGTDFDAFTAPELDDLWDKKKRNKRYVDLQKTVLIANETANHKKPVKQSNESVNEYVTKKVQAQTENRADGDVNLSDFFNMISEWFKTLENVKEEPANDKPDQEVATTAELLFKVDNSTDEPNTTEITTTTPSTTSFQLYDTDVIENIGHRSRMLLSVENLNATEEIRTGDVNGTREKRAETAGNASEASSLPTPTTKLDAVSTTMSNDIKEKRQTTKEERKVKAIFKRNADDSNLIFWNDIYDDEYGIQADKFDNTVRDKHSVNENDFIKKSGRWVHDKIRKFAENLKMNPHTQDMEIKERLPRSVSSPGLITYPKYLYERISDRLTRRSTDDREDDDIENEQKLIFTSLTANMKDVCKKAARAVQLSRNIEVREDSKQGSIATSLMQQLVRLLTDLVDYQVQQKTCTKLPSDLQNFLEWLTVPKEEAQEAQTDALTYKTPYQEDDLIDELEIPSDERPNDQPPDYETIGFNEKLGSGDLRIHYLDVLHSVQDLLDHYEEMSDEEKSKMTGVKSYLESQMRYLNKQLSGYDLYSLFEKHQHQMRYKRDLTIKPRLTKRRRKRKPQKYVKNFGKKHTRTTASFDDAVPITDNKRKVIKEDKSINKLINRAFEEKVSKDVRRNLKDVYYKAVAEAKKYATAKNVHKKDDNTAFESTSVSAHT